MNATMVAIVVSICGGVVVQAVLPALLRPAASIPVTRRGCLLVISARLLQSTLVIAVAILFTSAGFKLADLTTGATILLLGGLGIVGKYLSMRSRVVRVDATGLELVWSRTALAWRDVRRIGATPSAWIFTDHDGRSSMVSRGLDGAGCLALHIDDHVRHAVEIDTTTRLALLDAYRVGLREAGENPDAWLANRSGVISSVAQ